MNAALIVEQARDWLKTPYQHQGRVRAGLDCAGLLVVVGQACGYFPEKFKGPTDYGRNPTGILDGLLDRHFERTSDLLPGCVVALRWWKQSHHVGIVGNTPDYLTLIHSHAGYGGVTEHRLGAWHHKRITGMWNYRDAAL